MEIKVNCNSCLEGNCQHCTDPNCLCRESHGKKELEDSFTYSKLPYSHEELCVILSNPPLTQDSTISEITDYVMKFHNFKTLDDTKEILYYQDGFYQSGGEVIIAKLCEKVIPECSKYKVNEVTAKIQRRTLVSRTKFNKTSTKIVIKNGILDLQTMKLSSYDTEFLTTIKFDLEYDPKARCPKFVKFLKDCLRPRDVITVIEEISNIFNFNKINFEVSAMWIGEGSNGKSTLLKIMTGLFGPSNCSHVSIHAMQNQRFATAQIEGKPVNIHADISNKELNNLGVFKQMVSGEPIQVERKNQHPFVLVSFAKHFFSANEMPDIKDNSDGAFRRIYVTKWENQFLPGANRIEGLAEKILEAEKSGIFNLILENYKTLTRNKGFRYRQNIAEVRETIKRESDKIREFLDECTIKSLNGFITKEEFFNTYVAFCKYRNYEVYTKQKLGIHIPTYGIKEDQKKNFGRIWKNIAWNFESDFVKNNVRKEPKQELFG